MIEPATPESIARAAIAAARRRAGRLSHRDGLRTGRRRAQPRCPAPVVCHQGPARRAPGDRAHRADGGDASLGAQRAARRAGARRCVLAGAAHAGAAARRRRLGTDHRRPGQRRPARAGAPGGARAARALCRSRRRRHRGTVGQPLRPHQRDAGATRRRRIRQRRRSDSRRRRLRPRHRVDHRRLHRAAPRAAAAGRDRGGADRARDRRRARRRAAGRAARIGIAGVALRAAHAIAAHGARRAALAPDGARRGVGGADRGARALAAGDARVRRPLARRARRRARLRARPVRQPARARCDRCARDLDRARRRRAGLGRDRRPASTRHPSARSVAPWLAVPLAPAMRNAAFVMLEPCRP